MPQKFRESFEEMVDALRAHPKIKVIESFVRPPVSGVAIREAEKLLGRELPEDVLDFYLAHDGIYLSWGLEGRDYGDTIEPFGWPDYGTPPGVINILPMGQAFSHSWVQDQTVNWTDDDLRTIYGVEPEEEDEKLHALVIDFFSNYRHTDLVFGPVDRPGYVLIADDHGAELLESNLSSFTTYLDNVLAWWATERMPMYKVARYPHPQVIDKPVARRALDEVVAEVEKDG